MTGEHAAGDTAQNWTVPPARFAIRSTCLRPLASAVVQDIGDRRHEWPGYPHDPLATARRFRNGLDEGERPIQDGRPGVLSPGGDEIDYPATCFLRASILHRRDGVM